MQNRCYKCRTHGLDQADFESSPDSSDSANEEDKCENTTKFQEWKRDDNGYMTKILVTFSLKDGLELWKSRMHRLEEPLFAKRQQQQNLPPHQSKP